MSNQWPRPVPTCVLRRALPQVLVVHLKRFSYTSRLRDKLTTPVDFPLEGLDLSSHLLTEQEVPPVYDLFAVSNHMGSLGGGHYTAYAKQPGTERWYCFDDSRVSEVTADQVRPHPAPRHLLTCALTNELNRQEQSHNIVI